MGSLFTERAQPAGTFSHDDAKIGYPGRTPDLYYGYAWDDSPNAYGAAGRVFGPGSIATHGSLSPFDLTSVLIISGPDIRTGAVSPAPSGVVDIAPTVAWMSGLTPKGMDGRVLSGAFSKGPDPEKIVVGRHRVVREAERISRYLQFAELETPESEVKRYLMEGGIQEA